MGEGKELGPGRWAGGWRVAAVALLLLLAGGCEHPIAIISPHVEAADLVLTARNGSEIGRTEFNRAWSVDRLHITDGQPLELGIVPLDFRGNPIDLSDRGDVSFRMEAEDGALLQWEPLSGLNRIHPFGVGETRVRFLIWHINHADFVTPWLRVVVREASTAP